jgi:Protein of unknown function (DUF3800)
MLQAYFDETGIHAGSLVTFVAGFIGSADQWAVVNAQWAEEMGDEVFHYKNMRMQGERLDRLAAILALSGLNVVSAGFTGNWDMAIEHHPDWKTRFPSCYHFVFEMCVEQMDRWTDRVWNGEPIAIVFSRQNEYASRAEEIWRTHQANGFWKKLATFNYGDPKTVLPLQAADMIAYETFQCKRIDTDEVWHQWPLSKKLIEHGVPQLGGYHTLESFIGMMERADRMGRVFMKKVPKKI